MERENISLNMEIIDLNFMAGEIIENKLYFSSHQFNGLCVYDFETGNCEYVAEFIEEPWERYYLHGKCIKYKDLLIFTPRFGVHIHIYDMISGIQYAIKITDKEINKDSYGEPIIHNDELWLFSKRLYAYSVVVNLKNYSVRKFGLINEWCNKNFKTTEDILCTRIVYDVDCIWVGLYGSNKIIRVGLDSRDVDVFYVADAAIFGIYSGGNGLWVSEISGNRILRFNKKTEDVEVYTSECYFVEPDRCISQIIDVGSDVFVIPFQKGDVLKLISERKTFVKAFVYPSGCTYHELAFLNFYINEQNVYFFPYNNNGILKYNYMKKKVDFYPIHIKLNEWMIRKYIKSRLEVYKCVAEDKYIELNSFVEYIKK